MSHSLNPSLLIRVMLYFGDKSCFITEKSAVGNEDQTELNTGGQSVNF